MSVLKKKASIARAARLLALLTSFPLPVAYLIYRWSAQSSDLNVERPVVETTEKFAYNENSTILDILQTDSRISRFAEVVGQLPDIARGLGAPQAKFTLYVPVNEAFNGFFFPPDPPPFYNLFLAGYHMGPGPVPSLSSRSTVTSFVNGDIFFDYKQRISIQHLGDKITLNHEAKLLSPPDAPIAAANGFIHLIDTILVLPNSTAHVIRTRPTLSKLRNGLATTGLGRRIYNTNAHISQTVFAPTNAAFDNLGRSASKFLLSRAGQPYLDALLRMHVVANQTLFSDMFWPHGGAALVDLHAVGENTRKFELPTMHDEHRVTVESRKVHGRYRIHASFGNSSDVASGVEVSVADILTMDGVVHMIDSFMLPPRPTAASKSGISQWVSSFWHGGETIESLIERLEPYIETAR